MLYVFRAHLVTLGTYKRLLIEIFVGWPVASLAYSPPRIRWVYDSSDSHATMHALPIDRTMRVESALLSNGGTTDNCMS